MSAGPVAAGEEAPAPRHGPGRRTLVVACGMVASFTMVLSGTIVNVAVPDVMGAFGVGQDLAQLMATAYIATMTASQLLNAWFVARFGVRLSFSIVLILFAAGGLVCASAPGIDGVVVGRVMQGFAAGIVQPLVLVTIIQVFPPERRGAATGLYLSGLALALGFGPVVGGITIDVLGWRWIFLVPLPLVALSLLLGEFFMPAGGGVREPPAFDWVGYGLLCAGVFCLLSALSGGQRLGWTSDAILAYGAVGIAATAVFVVTQVRARSALLDFRLFANRRYAAAVALAFIYGIGNFSITYSIPVFGQLVQGLTPTAAGLLLLPAGLLVVLLTPITGRVSDSLPPVRIIVTGLALFVAGTWLLSGADVNTPFALVALFAVVCRLGMGCITPVLTSTAIRALPAEALARGTGTLNFFRQLGGAFGIGALVAFLERRTALHADALAATQTADNEATRILLERAAAALEAGGVAPPASGALALEHLARVIAAQASTFGYQDGFRLIALVFVAALGPAWLLARTGRGPGSRPGGCRPRGAVR